VLITDNVIEVGYPYPRRLSIGELHDVEVVRGGPDQVALGATVLAAAALVAGVVTWPFLHGAIAYLTAAGLMVAIAMVSAACWILNPREQALRATYRGYPVQLFSTRDPQTFGQVKRALMRALEAHRTSERSAVNVTYGDDQEE
jgi:hypothetical protein